MRASLGSLALCPLLAVGCASAPKPAVEAAPSAPAIEASKPVSAGTMVSACSPENRSQNVKTADVDGDGRPDMWKFYGDVGGKSQVTRQDLDLNWDGRVDVCRFFEVTGKAKREEADLDYDGKIDEVSDYTDGVVTMKKRDRDHDGRPDIIRRYDRGRLAAKEMDTNGDGDMDRFEEWKDGRMERVGDDQNHDGKVDRWQAPQG
ncbi:MAG: hypothetical protein HY791_05680 [Deltaproteobacteria bacterium]|nr:hypothetical protein [Deltaproteobacteria bacterium]